MSKDSRIDIDKELYNFLSEFGEAFQEHKFKNAIQPSLAVVVPPKDPSINKDSLKEKFLHLPAFAFNVSFITGTEYCSIAGTDMKKEDFSDENGWNLLDCNSDENGWNLLDCKGLCAYKHENKTVYIGYPYPTNNNKYLPLKRAIRHELGHYKQDVLKNAFNQSCAGHNIILEYHNIMINENTCADGPKRDDFYEGYRIKYNDINTSDTRDAFNILKSLYKKYANNALLKEMKEFVKKVNKSNNIVLQEVNNKLVQNMNEELIDKG